MKNDRIKQFIEFICDLQTLEFTPNILYDNNLPILAAYEINDTNYENATIKINPNRANNDILLYMSIAHELRHACQFEAIYSDTGYELMDKKLIDALKKNIENYIQPGKAGYKEQIIELDAFSFAEFIINTVFNIQLTYNETFTNDEIKAIHSYAKMFKNEYSAAEIAESLEYSGFIPNLIS